MVLTKHEYNELVKSFPTTEQLILSEAEDVLTNRGFTITCSTS